MATPAETLPTTAEADSFAAHKELRKAQREGKTPTESVSPKVEEEVKPESVKPSVSETEKPSESAEVSETSPAQEPKKPKRSDAESRIKELLADRDRTAAENAELKKKLDELAARPIETAKPAEPKVEAPKTVQGEPDLDEYVKSAPADETYSKTVQRFTRDYLKFLNGQQQKTAVEAKAQESAQASVNAAIAKHGRETLAAIIGTKDNPNSGIVMAPGVLKTFIDDYGQEGWDTLVHLHGNQEEYRRIQAIQSPLRQLNELAFLSRTLTVPAPKAETVTEKPRITAPPVSRVAPPAKQVSGSEISQPKSTGEALSFEEHKRLRKVAKG
jgi:hypothetical protein